MKALHCVSLGFGHLERVNVDLVLVAFAAGLDLVPDVHVSSAPGKATVQEKFIIRDF